MSIAKIVTPFGATVLVKGHKPFTMSKSHEYYPKLLEALKAKDEAAILAVIDIATKVKEYINTEKLVIRDGEILYNGENLTGVLVDRIFEHMAAGIDASNLIKFLENLQENPSYQSRKELYLFLEACGDLPITDDGRFIAYKWVRDDYKDVHSGTFDNSVGQIVEMPRQEVDDNRQHTCSAGLHVCSRKYSKFGSRLMLVAINPKDVVSVPYDYDNGKMRVCKYEVISEVAEAEYNDFNSPVYSVA